MAIALLLAAAAAVAAFAIRRSRRSDLPVPSTRVDAATQDLPRESTTTRDEIPYWTDATEEVATQCLKLAFGVTRFDYQIFADHARVLDLVERALGDAAEQQQYFPRRPLLLPKLLQALNDTESTRQELVQLILEDPVLAGTTLKRANNAFYRLSAEPVESLDRAVVVLGTDGLRSLVSTAILQPVFRLPKGFFDRFAEIAWELAQRSAVSAQEYAEAAKGADPFVAQLLGVLRSLATLVLFRLTLDKYRTSPNVLPRPEVFIRVIQAHRPRLAVEICKTWQLSEMSIEALLEQQRELSPSRMSPLGRAVYYGELSGSLATAIHHSAYSDEGARAILLHQGLTEPLAAQLLQAAKGTDLTP